jgi:hypothetical protein
MNSLRSPSNDHIEDAGKVATKARLLKKVAFRRIAGLLLRGRGPVEAVLRVGDPPTRGHDLTGPNNLLIWKAQRATNIFLVRGGRQHPSPLSR